MSDGEIIPSPSPEDLTPIPLIIPEIPDEDGKLVLSAKATKALDYLVSRLKPWFNGDGGEELLRYILTPLLKATHSKSTKWTEKIVASTKLAEMIGIYMAGENANRVKGFKALPRRNTGT